LMWENPARYASAVKARQQAASETTGKGPVVSSHGGNF
jgi:hypothetical protein